MVMVVPWAKKPISAGEMPLRDESGNAVEHAERGIFRRARDLLDQQFAGRRVEQHQIGVGAADVDPEPVTGCVDGLSRHGRARAGRGSAPGLVRP